MSAALNLGRNFLIRPEHCSDLIHSIMEFATNNQISAATFTAIGALKSAELGFYSQDEHEYFELPLPGPLEIASCVGNISLREGKPFVHAHAVLADSNCVAKGGHLIRGEVFAAEVHLTELIGRNIVRKYDSITGLSLWNL